MAKKRQPRIPKPDAHTAPSPRPRCGLCGKTDRLTKTPCCDQWICDDADKYVMFSFARNSCYRNHSRYTLCGNHYSEEHDGAWQVCAECRDEFEAEMYVYYGTNEYNFEKLSNPPAYEPTRCARCSKIIHLGTDAYLMTGEGYLCDSCTARDLAEEGGPSAHGVLIRAPPTTRPGPETADISGYPMQTIIARFDDSSRAQEAIDALLKRKYDKADISYLANDIPGGATAAPSGSAAAVLGLLAGLGTVAIPGVGPLLAAGPLAAGLAGTTASAAQEDGAWLAGALDAAGVPRANARAYGEHVRRNGALVLVRAHESVRDNITAILSSNGAVDIDLYQRDPAS